MDTQHFDGQQHRHIEYQVADVLQMVGLAEGSSSEDKCILMCQNSRKDFYKKVLSDPQPVESRLDRCRLPDFFNAEIATGTIQDTLTAGNYLHWTFLYHRMIQNPNYYNLRRRSIVQRHYHLQDLVRSTLEELLKFRCIKWLDTNCFQFKPLDLGKIASLYYINYKTIALVNQFRQTEGTTLDANGRTNLMVHVAASEFEDLPMRYGEEGTLEVLARRLRLPEDQCRFTDQRAKVSLILRAHNSRMQLSPELQYDTECVLKKEPKLMGVYDACAVSNDQP